MCCCSFASTDLSGREYPHALARRCSLTMATFLILSIVFNTLFAASYKHAVRRKCNLDAVNVWVYLGATVTVVAYILMKGKLPFHQHALLMGVVAGFMAFFSTLSFFYHMKFGQLSASWTVISLSIGIPIMASIFIWSEYPSSKQMVGLALIVVALTLFGRHETSNGGKKP